LEDVKKIALTIDRLLYSIDKFELSPVAKNEGFDSSHGLFNHLYGLVCHVKDVDPQRGEIFFKRFEPIKQKFDLELDGGHAPEIH